LIIDSIKSAIGFGIGLGANILTRFALKYPSKIYGLILVNCILRSAGWLEGFSLKVILFRKDKHIEKFFAISGQQRIFQNNDGQNH
jgi:pimeloyl-ACP methyl ester carboxylesterase